MPKSNLVVNPNIAGLTPYKPGKPVEELTRELGITDVVKLASNENPKGPGPKVQAAIATAAKELSRYPDGNGYYLKNALAQHLSVDGVKVAVDQITLGNGSNDVLDLAAKFTLQPGDEAITAQHSFVVYRLAVASAGAKLVEVPAIQYGADLNGFVAAVTPKTRVIFLANPNNPTGTWVTEAAVVELLEQVDPSIWVVLDEAYFGYVNEPLYPNGLALAARFPNLIVTRTFSKIYGLAALRVGYGVSSVAAADMMNRARQPFNVNAIAQSAAVAALADTDFVVSSAADNTQGLAQLAGGLQQLGLGFIPSVANFICFDAGPNAAAVNQHLLQAGVIVRPVAEYALPSHLRVTVGLPTENQRFLSALEQSLAAVG